MTQNNVMRLLIGKDLGAVSPTTAAGSPILEANDNYLLDGEMAVVNTHNIVLSTATVLTDAIAVRKGIRVVQRSGSTLVYSDIIKRAGVQHFVGATDTPAVQQVSYLGYDGVGAANAIAVLNSNQYEARLKFQEGDTHGFMQSPTLSATYKSDTTATQAEIAAGLHLAFAGSLWRSPEAPVRVERVVLETAAIQLSNNILTVRNGSKYVTWTAAATHAGGAFVAGDTIRIGTAGTGAAATDPAYILTSITGLVGTLDVPFQGANAAVPAIDVAHVVTPTNWGLKFTGLARGFTLGVQGSINNIVKFLIGVTNFGTTPVTYTTAAYEGRGTYRQIAELEWFLQGNEGNEDRGDFLHTTARSDADATATYDVLSIHYVDDHEAGLAMEQRSLKQLLLAFESGFATTEPPDIVIEVLELYCGASSGIAV